MVHPYTTEQYPKIYRHIFPNHVMAILKINSAKDSDPQLYNPDGWLQRSSRNMWLGQELEIGLTLSTQHSYRLAWIDHETVIFDYSGSKEQCPCWVQGFLQTVEIRIQASRLPLCLLSVSLPGRAWWRGQGCSRCFLKHIYPVATGQWCPLFIAYENSLQQSQDRRFSFQPYRVTAF